VRALEGLNPVQREAVTTTEGPLLIAAGPGSGKTRVIVHRIAYLIEARGVRPWQILAVTFTNKAANEMRERLARLLAPEAAEALLVGTFHRVCAQFLRRDGAAIGVDPRFVIYDEDDQQRLIRRAIQEQGHDEKRVSPRAVLATISRAKNTLQDAVAYARAAEGRWEETVAPLFRRYEELLAESRALDFDDLLLRVVDLFQQAPEVLARYQERYRYLLVDEFQDTNVVQYTIVRLLGERYRNVCVVGDIDQSIYSWRAAHPRNLYYFERDFPELRKVELVQNYRSTQTILAAANAIIRAGFRRDKNLWTENDRGIPITCYEAFNERDEAEYIVRQIRTLQARQGTRWGDCAVLYRTNAQTRVLEEAFVRYRVPYRIVGGMRFYERREIKDLLAYLRLVFNPRDAVSLERVLNVPPRELGAKSVQQLARWRERLGCDWWDALRLVAAEELPPGAPPCPLAPRARRACVRFVSLIDELRAGARELTLPELLDELLARTDYERYLRDDAADGGERWDNVRELRTALLEYEGVPAEQGLEVFLTGASLAQDTDDLGSHDTVLLMTLHTAKGLEFPYVFIAGLEEGLCPHSRSLDDEEQLAEEWRLFFVGATRAMRGLYLTYAARRQLYRDIVVNEPSRFLLELRALVPELLAEDGPTAWRQASASLAPSPARAAASGPSPRRPSAPPAPAALPRFEVGDRVYHAHFGRGEVVSYERRGGDAEVIVEFEHVGRKRLSLAYAKLERL